MRDNQYTIDGRIRFSEVDHTRRITLPGIVNYFQDCSTLQRKKAGMDPVILAGSGRTLSEDR